MNSPDMKKATLFTSPYYFNNMQFDTSEKTRDNCLYGFYLLKKKFAENGIDLSTQDINPPSESSFIIYNEMPREKDIFQGKDRYLLLFETDVIKPDNWNLKKHWLFKKIFTWHDGFVDNNKYFKINYSVEIPVKLDTGVSPRYKLCTMIAGHKFKSHPLEMYTARLKTIRWFEQNHPEDFDLFGFGWDKFRFRGALAPLNILEVPSWLLKPHYPSYKGTVKSKREILQEYRFSICYENARDIPGYITEKILDCLCAGCVPVYWGAPNVTDYISPETFIDRRNFENDEELFKYIKNMPDKQYGVYVNAIREFIEGGKIYPFSAASFANIVFSEITR